MYWNISGRTNQRFSVASLIVQPIHDELLHGLHGVLQFSRRLGLPRVILSHLLADELFALASWRQNDRRLAARKS